MSRLVRCIEGHIFEAEKGPNCPVCGAPTSLAQQAPASTREPPASAGELLGAVNDQSQLARKAAEKAPTMAATAGALAKLLSRAKSPVIAGGTGVAAAALGLIVFLLWPGQQELKVADLEALMSRPPGPEFVKRLPDADMAALLRRIDGLAPEAKGDSQQAELRLLADPDGSIVRRLRLSAPLVTALAVAHGSDLAATGDGKVGLRLLAAAARQGSSAAWASLGESLASRPKDSDDVRTGTNALIYAGNAGIGRAHYLASSFLAKDAWKELRNRKDVAETQLKLAAQLGHAAAVNGLHAANMKPLADDEASLVNGYWKNRNGRLPALIAAARRGWPNAAYTLSLELGDRAGERKGAPGNEPPHSRLKIDRAAAYEWLNFAASRNHVLAMRDLGNSHASGAAQGLQPNPAEAFFWYYLALANRLASPAEPDDRQGTSPGELMRLIDSQIGRLDQAQKAHVDTLLLPLRRMPPHIKAMLQPRPAPVEPKKPDPKSGPPVETVKPRPEPKSGPSAEIIAKTDQDAGTRPGPKPGAFDDLFKTFGDPGKPVDTKSGPPTGTVKIEKDADKQASVDLGYWMAPPVVDVMGSGLPDTDLLVRIGQSSEAVRAAYKIAAVPVPFGTASGPPSKTQLRKPEDGLWFFFTAATDRLETIRLDKPFNGRVVGLRIGEPASKLNSLLGEPTKVFPFNSDFAHLYMRTGWKSKVRFDVNSVGSISTIFISASD